MSAYIVSNKTISAIAKAFTIYGTVYHAANYFPKPSMIKTRGSEIIDIGQSLLDQNYASVNARYCEKTQAPKFFFEDVEINEGVAVGCINCYIYQACETPDFETSELYYSLKRLKDRILERFINKAGQEIPWGIY